MGKNLNTFVHFKASESYFKRLKIVGDAFVPIKKLINRLIRQ